MTTVVTVLRSDAAAIPWRSRLLLAAVLISGTLAGLRVSTVFLPLTLLFVAVLHTAAARTLRAPTTPAVPEPAPDTLLSAAARRRLAAVSAAISSGNARARLEDVVRRATTLLQAMAGQEFLSSTRRDVVDLVIASCDLAEELDQLERFLALPLAPGDPAPHTETRERCTALRDSLLRRLDEAAGAIETLHGQLLQENREAADRVAELATALSAEARARRDAAREIERLFAAGGR